jgi:hypothetical protein
VEKTKMATIEIANINKMKLTHVNIADTVGVGEKNDKNDVMLIQAMFKLIGYTEFNAKKFFGLTINDLPEPTGNFDEKTIRAIWAFQRKMGYRLLKIDGKIHPANYKNRVLKNAFQARVMAITFLNLNLIDGAIMEYNASEVDALKLIAPQLILRQVAP